MAPRLLITVALTLISCSADCVAQGLTAVECTDISGSAVEVDVTLQFPPGTSLVGLRLVTECFALSVSYPSVPVLDLTGMEIGNLSSQTVDSPVDHPSCHETDYTSINLLDVSGLPETIVIPMVFYGTCPEMVFSYLECTEDDSYDSVWGIVGGGVLTSVDLSFTLTIPLPGSCGLEAPSVVMQQIDPTITDLSIPDYYDLGFPEAVGITADGVSRVLVTMESPVDAAYVKFRLNDNSEFLSRPTGDPGLQVVAPFQPSETYDPVVGEITIPTTQLTVPGEPDPVWVASVLLTGPLNYVRESSPTPPSPDDEPFDSRAILFDVEFYDSSDGLVAASVEELELYRPPVVMFHGLWSNGPDCWGTPPYIETESPGTFGFIKRPSYPNDVLFADNLPRIRHKIAETIEARRNVGIATAQADVVGHSMGGVLARLHISSGRYQDNIHKLITLCSPHSGSGLAESLVNFDGTVTPFGAALALVMPSMSSGNGAVSDLREDWMAEYLGAFGDTADVPVHAIVGEGGSDITALAGILSEIADLIPAPLRSIPWVRGVTTAVAVVGAAAGGIDDVHDGVAHDLLVSEPSQRSSLASEFVTVFGLSPSPSTLGVHVTVQEESAERVVELLQARLDSDPSLFHPGFPNPIALAGPPAPSGPSTDLLADLTLSSPQEGTVVVPGQALDFDLTLPPGIDIDEGVLVTEGAVEMFSTTTTNVSVEVPAEVFGEVTFLAIGRDSDGVSHRSEPLTFAVSIAATAELLTVIPESMGLGSYANSNRLTVYATFSDGVERDVTSEALFVDLDPTGTVTVDRLVTGVGVGEFVVEVMFESLTASVPVTVDSIRGDYNNNGVLDEDDFDELMLAFSGPLDQAGFVEPPLAALDYFDYDADTDIDDQDLATFLESYPFAVTDCTASGIADVLEIATGAVLDCNGNWIPDSCDIAEGTVLDCDGNSIPDTCDIADGTLADANLDGVPDVCQEPDFVRGDCNQDSLLDIADAIILLGVLFSGGTNPGCDQACDVNDDGGLDVADGIFLLSNLFSGGPAPAPPYPACGSDETSDGLECVSFSSCP